MSALPAIQDADFASRVHAAGKPVLIDFMASWCAPCKALAPALYDIAREFGDEIDVLSVDIDDNPGLVERLAIRGVPTLMLFVGEEVAFRHTGALSRSALGAEIETVLDARTEAGS